MPHNGTPLFPISGEQGQADRTNFYALLHDPETKRVGMDDFGSVVAAPGEARRIATSDLAGCTAAVLAWSDDVGNRYAHVQHYNPNNRLLGVQVFTAALQESQDKRAVSSHAVIMGPGEWEGANADEQGAAVLDLQTDRLPVDQSPAANQTLPYLRDLDSAAALADAIGKGTDAKLYLYDTAWDAPGNGAILVELLPDGAIKVVAEGRQIPLDGNAPDAQRT